MAIGWGKSYEDQVEEGNQRLATPERGRRLTKDERVRAEREQSLRLSRSRVLDQLDRSRHPAHRETLLKALQALEHELEELSRAQD